MIKREIESRLLALFNDFPALTITGPRQSGKTTLIKSLFKHLPYVNLEDPNTLNQFKADPNGFLSQYHDGAIFDEFQKAPALSSYLQLIIDDKNKNGLFILSGSHQLEMMNIVSQSLAGRTAIVKLLPLSIDELSFHKYDLNNTNKNIIKGFYPRLYAKKEISNETLAAIHSSYIQTYLGRDINLLINIKDQDAFFRFLRLCAGRIGSVFVASQLANDVGVSSKTISSWISILQATYIIYMLPPFYRNIKKQLIKSPKLYFYDVGLACSLLRINTEDQLDRDPLRGSLFENMVVIDLLKQFYNALIVPSMFFYGDNHKREIDIIIQNGNDLYPVEIKSSKSFNKEYCKNIQFFSTLFESEIRKKNIVYDGENLETLVEHKIMNYRSFNVQELLADA